MTKTSVASEPYLVAVDGSEASKRAVLYAISLARQDGCSVVFVHVVETKDHQHDETPKPAFLDDALQAAKGADVVAESRILRGRAREEIIAAASDVDPGLIFVGASGLTGLQGWVLGSVAADVMRYSDKPVVVVPPTAPPPKESAELLSRMLVPIDPGAEDASTAAFAIALARGTQRQIIFCAVVDESRIVSLTAEVQGGYVLPDLLTEVRLGAQQVIDAAIAQARVRGIVAEGYVVSGEPIAAICKLAGEKTGTAIVMGTHGRLGLSRMFIGSTTQGVLRAAQIPVVTLLLRHDKCAADPAIDPAAEAVDRKLIST